MKIYNAIHNETLTAEDDIIVPSPFDHRVMQIRMTALHLQALWWLGGAKNGRAAIPNGTPDGAVHLKCTGNAYYQ
jgi:hypothetical protein